MDRRWAWDRQVPLRWLLVDEFSEAAATSALPLGVCAEIDGLFVDPEPPPAPEHYTLIGCEPAGPLREVLQYAGTDRAWLAGVALQPVHDPQRPPPDGCERFDPGCSCMEELFDVTVLGYRTSAAGHGLVDIDLRGHLRILLELDWPPAQEPDAREFLLAGDKEEPLGSCRRTAGVFRERPAPPVHPVTFVGCRPEAPLRATLEHRSAWRRHLQAAIYAVDGAGLAAATGRAVSATVTGSRPSRLGNGLVDITLDDGVGEPLPSGAGEIWRMWHTGRPARCGLWAGYDRALRHEWAGAALAHHPDERPDPPPGRTYHLDGRFVTDIEGFYCAVGEAVNGPAGYFGWNLDALADCLRGRWGAAPPFRLIWHHADVARRHLVSGYDRPAYAARAWGPAITLHDLLDMFAEAGVDVELR